MYTNFEKIRDDPEVIAIYQRIKDADGQIAYHDLCHVLNVCATMESVLRPLGYDEAFIDEALVAGILHDVGVLEGKDGHPERSFKWASAYLKRQGIKLCHEREVLEAIANHSSGFDTDNIIQLTLILADKLDIKKTRVAPGGLIIPGMREYRHIEDIVLTIDDETLKVNFITDADLNLAEMLDYYFTIKTLKAIKAFAKKIGRKPIVLLNGEPLVEFEGI